MSESSILILGAGRSGSAVAEYCAARPERFGPVVLVDSGDSEALRAEAERLSALGVEVSLGVDTVEGAYTLCVASPGIKPASPLMQSARAAATAVISELEFAFRESDHRWVAITGTNGKTTTTALTTHLLVTAGIPAVSVGNIGSAATAALETVPSTTVLVAEVSSFQLALTSRFRPRVAVLLNITPDHTDWHGSMDAYVADKGRVFANMGPGDTAVIDVDDPESAAWADKVRLAGVPVVEVCASCEGSNSASANGGLMSIPGSSGRRPLLRVDEMLIKGPHNVSNALAAAAAASAMGASPQALALGLATFRPIEHRLEPAGVVRDVEWFNDSKATNPDAVSKALASFGDQPLIVLLGGRNKGSDFTPLAMEASARARAVILFGECREQMASAFAVTGLEPQVVGTMAEAVALADRIALPGDAVVLSPACASFDEFDNYEARGEEFKRLVRELGAS
jgi:UDP-N-acetylmuramoylalanine--D-glutamate ligase